MSYSASITITVSGFRPERERALCGALEGAMKDFEDGWDISEATSVLVNDEPVIRVASQMPIIISGSPPAGEAPWEERFTREVTAAALRANGRDCGVSVEIAPEE